MPQPAVSRILSAFARLRERRRDDHSSRPGIADGLKRPTRKLRTGRSLVRLRPCASYGETSPPYLVLLRAGFCLPSALRQTRCALTAPFHPYSPSPFGLWRSKPWGLPRRSCEASVGGRYIFCATSPSGYPDRALPGALPCGVRTFLSPCGKRSSGPLRQAIVLHGPAKAGLYRSSGDSPGLLDSWTLVFRLLRHPSVSCRIAYCSSFL